MELQTLLIPCETAYHCDASLSYKTNMFGTYVYVCVFVCADFGSMSCSLIRIGLLLCLFVYRSVEFPHSACPYATR